jgi:type IV pilus assembly protein PilB
VSALNCVLAQRLVRNICIHCKRPRRFTRAMLEESALDPSLEHRGLFFEGAGCIECGGTGGVPWPDGNLRAARPDRTPSAS